MKDIHHWPLDKFKPYEKNPRKNDHAVDKIAAAINEFGFRVPILAKSDGVIADGHLRLKAAQKLKLDTVPVLLVDDMSEAQIKAFRISINKIAELADWDLPLLSHELKELQELDFDLDLLGFDNSELTKLLGDEDLSVSDGPQDKAEQFILEVIFPNEQLLNDEYGFMSERGLIVRRKVG